MTQHRGRTYLIPVILAASTLVVLLWAYAPTLGDIAWRWGIDPQYSHGYLVPVFALALLWLRRNRLDVSKLQPSVVGLIIIVLATCTRLAGSYVYRPWFDQMSLVGCIGGLVVLIGGRAAWRWTWPAVAFLAFMIPLPHAWAIALIGPMQTFATEASTYCLQALGRPALSEGNVILLDDLTLGIVEACSGLRMLVVFFALSTAVAMLSTKPLWERLVVAASAIPIALVSNVLRITATGILMENLGREAGETIHDVMGWLMMPIGLAFLGLELWILGRLLLPTGTASPANAGNVSLTRVAFNPVATYRREGSPRRRQGKPETKPATAKTATPKPAAEAAVQETEAVKS